MPRATTVVSAGVYLALNGKKYAPVSAFSWAPSVATRTIHGIDSLLPFELVPGATRCTGRITIWRTIGGAGAEGAGMAALQSEIHRQKYFTLQLIERGSDTVLFEGRYSTWTAQSWTAAEKGRVVGVLDFESLDFSNELQHL